MCVDAAQVCRHEAFSYYGGVGGWSAVCDEDLLHEGLEVCGVYEVHLLFLVLVWHFGVVCSFLVLGGVDWDVGYRVGWLR